VRTNTTTTVKSFSLYHAQLAALKDYAWSNRLSLSRALQLAIDEYLQRHETQKTPAEPVQQGPDAGGLPA
jgi:hypothetical protein